MKQDIKYYENRAVTDKEFPIEIGHKIYHKNRSFYPHWHEDIEIHYMIAGELKVIHDQQPYIVKEGDLLITNSNVLHAGSVEGDCKADTMNVILNLEVLSPKLADRRIMFQRIISKDPFICKLMEELYREHVERKEGYRLMCKGLVVMLMGHLTRYYIEEELTEKEKNRRVQKLERLTPVIRYIERRYTEEIRNQELADIVHLSEDRFNHFFKECMGISPLQYMNRIRMEKAMQLLKTKQYLAADVASMVGIPNYVHFGRLFLKTYGCSPGQVLKEDLNTENKI